MDTEKIAWIAFRLNGSIEAYLLHRSLENAMKKSEDADGQDKGLDN